MGPQESSLTMLIILRSSLVVSSSQNMRMATGRMMETGNVFLLELLGSKGERSMTMRKSQIVIVIVLKL